MPNTEKYSSKVLRLLNNVCRFWGFDSHWGHACQMRFTLMGVCVPLRSQTSSKYHLLMAYITIFQLHWVSTAPCALFLSAAVFFFFWIPQHSGRQQSCVFADASSCQIVPCSKTQVDHLCTIWRLWWFVISTSLLDSQQNRMIIWCDTELLPQLATVCYSHWPLFVICLHLWCLKSL